MSTHGQQIVNAQPRIRTRPRPIALVTPPKIEDKRSERPAGFHANPSGYDFTDGVHWEKTGRQRLLGRIEPGKTHRVYLAIGDTAADGFIVLGSAADHHEAMEMIRKRKPLYAGETKAATVSKPPARRRSRKV